MPTKKSSTRVPTVHLVESDDATPVVALKPGMRFEVRVTRVIDPQMRPAKKIAARLCGGTDTCLALVEI